MPAYVSAYIHRQTVRGGHLSATGGLYGDAASASELVRVLGEFVDLIRQQP